MLFKRFLKRLQLVRRHFDAVFLIGKCPGSDIRTELPKRALSFLGQQFSNTQHVTVCFGMARGMKDIATDIFHETKNNIAARARPNRMSDETRSGTDGHKRVGGDALNFDREGPSIFIPQAVLQYVHGFLCRFPNGT
tara:strand:+ start:50 stop:460 length:411 start_codon:yes stop_codon:yes gene_type:complete